MLSPGIDKGKIIQPFVIVDKYWANYFYTRIILYRYNTCTEGHDWYGNSVTILVSSLYLIFSFNMVIPTRKPVIFRLLELRIG